MSVFIIEEGLILTSDGVRLGFINSCFFRGFATYRFNPYVAGRASGKRRHQKIETCVPRWVKACIKEKGADPKSAVRLA